MEQPNKKKIFVFGAGGFIGTYLIEELLLRKYDIVASDINPFCQSYYQKKNIPFLQIDITNRNDFSKIEHLNYDIVIHLAAMQPANVSENKFDPKEYINVNVIGTLNVLEFCKKNDVGKIIYACSHRNTEGLWKKDKAIKEDDGISLKFHGEYAMFSISESGAQNCLEYYRAQHGLKSIIFRLPPVYGYGPHTEIFKNGKPELTGFQTFINNAIENKPLEMWGDSSIGRDIIYVKDVVSAFIKAIENEKAYGLFNITSGKYLTLKDQVEITAKVFSDEKSTPNIIELKEKPNLMDSFLYSNNKAKEILGWSPQYSFEEMLLDYKLEMKNRKFEYLLEKRKNQFNDI